MSTTLRASSDAKAFSLIGSSCGFLAVAWASVSLRVYVRHFMIKSFGRDDWLILMTLVRPPGDDDILEGNG